MQNIFRSEEQIKWDLGLIPGWWSPPRDVLGAASSQYSQAWINPDASLWQNTAISTTTSRRALLFLSLWSHYDPEQVNIPQKYLDTFLRPYTLNFGFPVSENRNTWSDSLSSILCISCRKKLSIKSWAGGHPAIYLPGHECDFSFHPLPRLDLSFWVW